MDNFDTFRFDTKDQRNFDLLDDIDAL